MRNFIFILGRNLDSIFDEACDEFGITKEDNIYIITREHDQLEVPDLHPNQKQVLASTAPVCDNIYVIANGGTTAQMIPYTVRLVQEAKGLCEIIDLQKDGKKTLWSKK